MTVAPTRPNCLKAARAVGEAASQLATDRAERDQPGFLARAERAVLERLAAGPASAEDLTEHVKATGLTMKDARAMGSVYSSMRRRGLIEIAGELPRRYGHGTSGGHLWRRC